MSVNEARRGGVPVNAQYLSAMQNLDVIGPSPWLGSPRRCFTMHPWRFSVFSRRKLLLKSRDPVEHDRAIDLTIAWRKVNAAYKNKRVLFERRRIGRRKSPPDARAGKECFSPSGRAARAAPNPCWPPEVSVEAKVHPGFAVPHNALISGGYLRLRRLATRRKTL